ncbi:DUF6503 family protein [Arenibacter certesii]|uniref:Deoxyribose-phosphate aldolase n=1 Tax=Arenibacter certesii TaxID=228955 RepID=A0A918J253_9FLAO|nr:DUF6503 family protein [Arenibacter certesii]GGW43268.1 hypothetical protein GCM10007383_29840 [Arenibacter certesii]
MMRVLYFAVSALLWVSCKEQPKTELSAQEIVNKSIFVSGGDNYKNRAISFSFRELDYKSSWEKGKRILSRTGIKDSVRYVDVLKNNTLERTVGEGLVALSDSIANVYSNSLNSVHYFVNLPYGLNDHAVNKELLGEVKIKNKDYYKIKVTFEQAGGGDDFEDVYVYWINKETFKPDYLAYEFHINGGGIRFRVAYNERYLNGIRIVDYENYKASPQKVTLYETDKLYEKGELELLSKIELENVVVKALD